MKPPRLTVLMTVYNGLPYLREAIESILNQTYHAFKFLIVDDASTDGTRDLINSYDDSRIQLEALPRNIGQTAALNYGLRHIDTQWVARMDSDDISLPHRFQKQMDYLNTHPGVVLIGTAAEHISHNGKHLKFRYKPCDHKTIGREFIERNMFIHSSVIFRNDIIKSLGGYPKSNYFIQDRPMWLEILSQYQVANLPDVLVKIRIHSQQWGQTANHHHRYWKEKLEYTQHALKRLDLSEPEKKKGELFLLKAKLNYAKSLSENGLQAKAVAQVFKIGMEHLNFFVPNFQNLFLLIIGAIEAKASQEGLKNRWKTALSVLIGQQGRSFISKLAAG